MIGVETVSIVLASAGVLVALVYYASQLRHQTKLRQTDLIMRLESNWDSRELEKGVNELMSMVRKFKDWDEFKKEYPRWEKLG